MMAQQSSLSVAENPTPNMASASPPLASPAPVSTPASSHTSSHHQGQNPPTEGSSGASSTPSSGRSSEAPKPSLGNHNPSPAMASRSVPHTAPQPPASGPQNNLPAPTRPTSSPLSAANGPPSGSITQNDNRSPTGVQSDTKSVEHSPEYLALIDVIKKSSPGVVRQAIRDQWHKCLMGSEFHTAFLVSGSLLHLHCF